MDVASSTQSFLDAVGTNIDENLGIILAFAAGILMWGVAKKWIFGGTSRV